MSIRCMYRYVVAIDGHPHEIKLSGSPVAVAAVGDRSVEFWAQHNGPYEFTRTFQVFGTGHPLPDDARWRGTCARTPSGHVWHLYELGVPV